MRILSLGLLATAAALGSAQTRYSQEVLPASEFVDRVGVHGSLWPYRSQYGDLTRHPQADNFFLEFARPKVLDLGIRHMRVQLPSGRAYQEKLRNLGRQGIRFNLILDPRLSRLTLPQMRDAVKSLAPAIESVEGPNEWDIRQNNTDWVEPLVQFVKDLRTTFRADPETEKLPILGPSITGATVEPVARWSVDVPSFAPWIDYGSVHMYDKPLVHAPGGYDDRAWKYRTSMFGDRPLMVTETGFDTSKGNPNSVSETVQAVYLMRKVFTYREMGVRRTYLFQLMDVSDSLTQVFGRAGLVRYDGTVRPSYTALQRTLRLFSDTGKPSDLKPFTFTAEGDTRYLMFSAWRRQSGETILALWRQVPSTDTPSAKSIELDLPSGIREATLYDPMESDKPVWRRRVGSDGTLRLEATDRVQFLWLSN